MIQLYDHYNQSSQDLHYSLSQAGYEGPVVVVNDDGFLPEGVTSIYTYFCGMEPGQGKPLYFNQLPVPEFWEIGGNNSQAEVWDYSDLRAKIFYAEPKHRRFIKNVDWLDKKQKVRFTDYYNQSGWLFARTYFTADQALATKSYFNQSGQEVIVENFLTGDTILNWGNKTYFFDNKVKFMNFFFELMGWETDRIWYNSLGTPFMLSYQSAQKGDDILFWQEGIGDELPGNMRVMLNNPNTRTQRVIVQNRQVYEKMLSLATPEQAAKISYLGFTYPQVRENGNRKEILILTNSDQIEHLDALTEHLRDYTFHIAALTEMSQRLVAFEAKANVKLYPNVSQANLDRLFELCDVYFDINQGSEVANAVRRAFENQMLIFAFYYTSHNPGLTLPEHSLKADQIDVMINRLREYEGRFQELAHLQAQGTSHEQPEAYQLSLGETK